MSSQIRTSYVQRNSVRGPNLTGLVGVKKVLEGAYGPNPLDPQFTDTRKNITEGPPAAAL